VLELALYFLKRHADRAGSPLLGLSPEAAKKLAAYAWPGNVRELENCMERAVAFARCDQIAVDDLPEKIGAYVPDRFAVVVNDANEILPLDEVERRYVSRALGILGNNKTRAAELLGVDRRTLYRKIDRWQSLPLASSVAPVDTSAAATSKLV
jgi:two-component system response regulator HydG